MVKLCDRQQKEENWKYVSFPSTNRRCSDKYKQHLVLINKVSPLYTNEMISLSVCLSLSLLLFIGKSITNLDLWMRFSPHHSRKLHPFDFSWLQFTRFLRQCRVRWRGLHTSFIYKFMWYLIYLKNYFITIKWLPKELCNLFSLEIVFLEFAFTYVFTSYVCNSSLTDSFLFLVINVYEKHISCHIKYHLIIDSCWINKISKK